MNIKTILSVFGVMVIVALAVFFIGGEKLLPQGFAVAEPLEEPQAEPEPTPAPVTEPVVEQAPQDPCAGFEPELVECPADECGGDQGYYWIDYPESGYTTCKDGETIDWDCSVLSEDYSRDCVRKTARFSGNSGGYSGPGTNDVEVPTITTNVVRDTNVPEFSLVTLVAAVVVVGLGLVFLRKN